MVIRPARDDDVPAIAAIHTASWRDAYSDVLPADYLAVQVERDLHALWAKQEIRPRDDVVLVAETTDRPVGFVAVWCRPTPFVDNLHVSPSMRSRGIGTALMRAAARRLVEQGHSTAYLWVFEGNLPAIRFYERLGAVRTGRAVKEFFGQRIPSVRMEWSDLGAMGGEG